MTPEEAAKAKEIGINFIAGLAENADDETLQSILAHFVSTGTGTLAKIIANRLAKTASRKSLQVCLKLYISAAGMMDKGKVQ